LRLPDDVARFAASSGLPRDEGGPVFAEPWQAQAFALTVQLHAAGYFSWREWAEELGAALRGEAAPYYDCWLVALERICLAKGLTDAPALIKRAGDWADAYRRTPHGQPVALGGA